MTSRACIETIHEDADLRLRWLKGASRRLVVCFTGRHHEFGGQPMDEFAASAHENGTHNVLFVSDLQQSWYSRPGLWARILRLIDMVRSDNAIQEVVTLGNSMGGFGALLLPRDMRVCRAIGFCAQVSMDPSVIKEDRWPAAQRRFGTLPSSNIAASVPKTDTHYYLVSGRSAPKDLAQMALMPRIPRVRTWALSGAGHNLAQRLKSAGALYPSISALCDGKTETADQIFTNFQSRQSASGLDLHRRETNDQEL